MGLFFWFFLTILFFSLAQCIVDLYELTTPNLHLYVDPIVNNVSYWRSLTGHRFNLIYFPLVARNLCMICPNRCPCLLKFALLAKATQIFDFIFANLFKIYHSVLHKSRTKSLGISHSLSIYPGTYLTCQHFPQHTIDFFSVANYYATF